jgi:single-strand DNA-binding protein
MSDMNSYQATGRFVRDPELRTTPKGTAVLVSAVAINRTWKDGQGKKQEQVCFVDVEAWGKTAEVIHKYFTKGKPICFWGRLDQDRWLDKKDGQKRSKLKVVIDGFTFIGGGAKTQDQAPAVVDPADATPQGDAVPEIPEQDIPF